MVHVFVIVLGVIFPCWEKRIYFLLISNDDTRGVHSTFFGAVAVNISPLHVTPVTSNAQPKFALTSASWTPASLDLQNPAPLFFVDPSSDTLVE